MDKYNFSWAHPCLKTHGWSPSEASTPQPATVRPVSLSKDSLHNIHLNIPPIIAVSAYVTIAAQIQMGKSLYTRRCMTFIYIWFIVFLQASPVNIIANNCHTFTAEYLYSDIAGCWRGVGGEGKHAILFLCCANIQRQYFSVRVRTWIILVGCFVLTRLIYWLNYVWTNKQCALTGWARCRRRSLGEFFVR